MKKIIVITSIIALALASCRKVIDLKLNNSEAQYVLKGEVNEGEIVHTLTITKTVAFDEDNVFPGVSGANVVLSDDQGNSETLVDLGNGNYETVNFLGVEGRIYTFSVTVDGKSFESKSTIPVIVPLTGLEFIPVSFFGQTGYAIVPKFLDQAGVKNSYLFYYYKKDSVDVNSGYIISNDDFADGKLNEQPFFGDYGPSLGDTVIYKMWGIDENVYKYYFSFDQNTSGNSGAPANPVSNWTNNALGYFTAQNFQSLEVVVQ
jgi:hypothetical protein